ALGAGKRKVVDRPVGGDLEGLRRNGGADEEKQSEAQPGDERGCKHRRQTIQEIAVSARRKLWHASKSDNRILPAAWRRARPIWGWKPWPSGPQYSSPAPCPTP